MARTKDRSEWVSGREASTILTRNSGHHVGMDYVRTLARDKKIRVRPIDGRTNEYHRGDLEGYTVRKKSNNAA